MSLRFIVDDGFVARCVVKVVWRGLERMNQDGSRQGIEEGGSDWTPSLRTARPKLAGYYDHASRNSPLEHAVMDVDASGSQLQDVDKVKKPLDGQVGETWSVGSRGRFDLGFRPERLGTN